MWKHRWMDGWLDHFLVYITLNSGRELWNIHVSTKYVLKIRFIISSRFIKVWYFFHKWMDGWMDGWRIYRLKIVWAYIVVRALNSWFLPDGPIRGRLGARQPTSDEYWHTWLAYIATTPPGRYMLTYKGRQAVKPAGEGQ